MVNPISLVTNFSRLRKKIGLKNELSFVLDLQKIYGTRVALRAIHNKLHNLPLFYNVKHSKIIQCNENKIDYDKIGKTILEKQQSEIKKDDVKAYISNHKELPHISIIMPIYNPQIKWLDLAIQSLINQYYPFWELIMVDDGSSITNHFELIKKYEELDRRIKLIKKKNNEGISVASNLAIQHSNFPYIALMDQDDEITADCLFWFAKEINENPYADFIYSDECKISESNECFDFYFKPDWSPFLLYSHMYTSHLVVYKKDLVNKIGGFRKKYDFSQDYDLALRASKIATNIRHIERILYHWRVAPTSGSNGGKNLARRSNINALEDYFHSCGIKGNGRLLPGRNSFVPKITNFPLISIIIPSDNYDSIKKCVTVLFKKTRYKNIEVIVVTNSNISSKISKTFRNKKIHTCDYNGIFNFSAKCNLGIKKARGEYVVIYNDDVYPQNNNWLEKLLEVALLPNVSSVSPCCIFENGLIQYAGMYTNTIGLISTAFINTPYCEKENSPFNHFLMRDVSIMSGACSLINKRIFNEVGGFDEVNTPNGHSDIVLSFKMIEKGYHCVYNPDSVVVHIGNHSWHAKYTKDKSDIFLLKYYGKYISHDMHYTDSQRYAYSTIFNKGIYKIYDNYIPTNHSQKRDILFVTHDLTISGAPLVLINVIQEFVKKGFFPVIVSHKDGPLKKQIIDLKIPLIIYEDAREDTYKMLQRFARNFDIVFANTIVCGKTIECLQNDLPKLIWWLLEGEYAIEIFKHLMPTNLTNKNINIFAISNYSKTCINKYFPSYDIKILPFGTDYPPIKLSNKENTGKLNVLIVGDIEKRKGIDIVINAYKLLPESSKNKLKFLVVGNHVCDVELSEYFNNYKDIFKRINRIPQKDFLNILSRTDLILIPSRDEPLSMIAVEAMAYKIPFICSTNTGISEYIDKNDQNFLVFENNNPYALSQKINYFINDRNKLKKFGYKLYDLYINNFTSRIFNNYFEKVLDNIELDQN